MSFVEHPITLSLRKLVNWQNTQNIYKKIQKICKIRKFSKERLKFNFVVVQSTEAVTRVMDSCRDEWNVRNCSASQGRWSSRDRWSVQNWWWMKCTKFVDWLRSLNMNIPKFKLLQLQEHKLCVSSETHVDVVVLVVRVAFVCLFVWYIWKFLCYHS